MCTNTRLTCSGHMWENQVLLTDVQVAFPLVLRFFFFFFFFVFFFFFCPTSMNDRLDISEIFLKGP